MHIWFTVCHDRLSGWDARAGFWHTVHVGTVCQLHFLSYKPERVVHAIDQINSHLQSISKGSESNGLKHNVRKCTALHVALRDLIQALSDKGMEVRLITESLTICDGGNLLLLCLTETSLYQTMSHILHPASPWPSEESM